MSSLWYVAAQDPGTSSFREFSCVAVNFYVRCSVAGLSTVDIKAAAAGGDPNWDRKVPGWQSQYARQLSSFAAEIADGDQIVTFDPLTRHELLVGRVLGGYEYQNDAVIEHHPHVRWVQWLGTVARTDLPEGLRVRAPRGATVQSLGQHWDLPVVPLDDGPGEGIPRENEALPPRLSRRQARASRPPDRFEWEPRDGDHRHLLKQHFNGEQSVRALLVIMLNPAANRLAGLRQSTTCHSVRRWAQAHGYDGAIYLNLFSYIEPNSTYLRRRRTLELNDPGADEAIERAAREFSGEAVAAWGNLPPGLTRVLYDERIAQVQRLLHRPLHCMGLTKRHYPRHGRGWRHEDPLVPFDVAT